MNPRGIKPIERSSTRCIIWTGSMYGNGYGRVWDGEKMRLAHRVAYVEAHGEIPEGTEIHHRCETPGCVNPDHLEAVTRSEHRRAHGIVPPRWQSEKTHCPKGHEYDEANTYIHNDKRFCRICHRESAAAKAEARKVYRDLTCPQCSTEFTTSDARKTFCSRRCKSKANNARRAAA